MKRIDFEEFEEKMLKHRESNGLYEHVVITLKENDSLMKFDAIKILNENFQEVFLTLDNLGELKYTMYSREELFKKPSFKNKDVYTSREEQSFYAEQAISHSLNKVIKINKRPRI